MGLDIDKVRPFSEGSESSFVDGCQSFGDGRLELEGSEVFSEQMFREVGVDEF